MQDDIFGSSFEVCDSDFDSQNHIATVTIPGVQTASIHGTICGGT